MIDLCGQDAHRFQTESGLLDRDSPIVAGQVGDLKLLLRYPDRKTNDAVLTINRNRRVLLTTKLEDFEGAYGWVVASPDKNQFAVTWSANESDFSTKIFKVAADGSLTEDTPLIEWVEKAFLSREHRFCSNPSANLRAIKWIDAKHLLLSVDGWGDFECDSNYTEGFIVDTSTDTVQKRLTEHDLVNLPAVCTSPNEVKSGRR